MPRRRTDNPRKYGLHIKLTKAEDAAIRATADADLLEVSVWARRVLLRAIEAQARARPDAGREGQTHE